MQNKSCAVIGEPPVCFPWGYDEEDQRCVGLKLLILRRLSHMKTKGATHFYIPIDAGIGLYASELAVSLLAADPELRLYNLIQQAVKWSPELRSRYYAVQEQCTEPILVSGDRTPTSELDVMLEAIDRADRVLTVCAREPPRDRNLVTALRYAQKIGRDVQLITPPGLY